MLDIYIAFDQIFTVKLSFGKLLSDIIIDKHIKLQTDQALMFINRIHKDIIFLFLTEGRF